MIQRLSFASLALLPKLLLAGACCLGSGPKSFVQLRPLQSYEVGLSSSFKDVYARYNSYGELISAEKNQTHNLSVGATTRLGLHSDLFAILPWVSQFKAALDNTKTKSGLGDTLVGFRHRLLENLFEDEWYPKVTLSLGLKMPTGTVEKLDKNGELVPGTGNGLWEPSIGIAAQKDYGSVILSLIPSYTLRMRRTVTDSNGRQVKVNEGDRIDLTESLTFPLSRELSASVGSTQSWDFSKKIDGKTVGDSYARVMSAFVTASYFLTRFWSVGLGIDGALPVKTTGLNQEAARTVTLTTNYSIF